MKKLILFGVCLFLASTAHAQPYLMGSAPEVTPTYWDVCIGGDCNEVDADGNGDLFYDIAPLGLGKHKFIVRALDENFNKLDRTAFFILRRVYWVTDDDSASVELRIETKILKDFSENFWLRLDNLGD